MSSFGVENSQTVLRCQRCRSVVRPQDEYCTHCGALLGLVMCPQCQYQGPYKDFYNGCPRCGFNKNIEKKNFLKKWRIERHQKGISKIWKWQIRILLGLLITLFVAFFVYAFIFLKN